jgi:hypothetical protein
VVAALPLLDRCRALLRCGRMHKVANMDGTLPRPPDRPGGVVYLMLPLRPSGKNRPLPVAEPAVTMDTT